MSGDPARSAVLAELAERYAAIEARPLPGNLGALLDAAVARYGERISWVQLDDNDRPGETLRFCDIGDLVGRCATVLAETGIAAGDRVALMLPGCPAFVITWLACARLGAAIIPVNTRYTADELGHLLDLAEPNAAVVDAAHTGLFSEVSKLPSGKVLVHDSHAPEASWQKRVGDAAPMRDFPEIDAETMVNLQFTSGSTGLPKACMLPHSYWLVLSACRAIQGPPVHRILLDMPFHYMGGQWRFLLSLVTGATVYVAARPSLTRMIDRLIENDIEFCSITPAFAKQAPDPRREQLSLVWAGTMAMPPDLLPQVSARLGNAPVREMYGTTETGAIAAMPFEVDWQPGGCGIATPFRRLSIRDDRGRELPAGAEGELWVSGPGFMLGYYRNRQATEEALVDGWYRTGDLCRIDEDGFLTIVGRIKDTIRRSGENISATEVENVIARLDIIEDIAAIPVADPYLGEEVMVCITRAPHADEGDWPAARIASAVRDHAAAHLAKFKRPRYLAVLSAMPKTASGKNAKAQLRKELDDWCVERIDIDALENDAGRARKPA